MFVILWELSGYFSGVKFLQYTSKSESESYSEKYGDV